MPMKKVLNTAKKYWMVSLIISLIFSGCSSKENNKKIIFKDEVRKVGIELGIPKTLL